MELPTKEFHEALQAVSAIVPGKATRDIFKSVRFSTANGVTLYASDGELAIQRHLDVPTPSRDVSALIPPDRLRAILRETEAGVVSLEITDACLTVKAGRSVYKLQTSDAAEFPEFPAIEMDLQSVSGDALSLAIDRTIFSTDEGSNRYALGGLLFDPGAIVATDSRRLSVAPLDHSVQGRPVVPVKAAKALRSIAEGDVKIGFSGSHMMASCGQTTMSARLMEGRFPKWQDIIPRSASGVAVLFLAGPLLSAVRQSMIVTNPESSGVTWKFGRGTLELSSVGKDIGDARVVLPIELDDDVVFTLDPKFVVDWLKTLEPSSQVEVLYSGEGQPVLFTHAEFCYVVMPLAK